MSQRKAAANSLEQQLKAAQVAAPDAYLPTLMCHFSAAHEQSHLTSWNDRLLPENRDI